jgi:hypothetical protein
MARTLQLPQNLSVFYQKLYPEMAVAISNHPLLCSLTQTNISNLTGRSGKNRILLSPIFNIVFLGLHHQLFKLDAQTINIIKHIETWLSQHHYSEAKPHDWDLVIAGANSCPDDDGEEEEDVQAKGFADTSHKAGEEGDGGEAFADDLNQSSNYQDNEEEVENYTL